MTETGLVERYVHQVGYYLPPKERAEVEAELRSQIHDQLEDRYGAAPTQDEVAAVLAELGDPHRMATSYNSERYLVGPELYPFMMLVLQHGWSLVPALVAFLHVFGGLVSQQQPSLLALAGGALLAALQAGLAFSAVVVLLFALIQQSGLRPYEKDRPFDPLELPPVDDPGVVDRAESAFGIAISTFVTLVLLYFLHVGGLTLNFNLSDPGEVTPVAAHWLLLMLVIVIAMALLALRVLRRGRWTARLWAAETVLEVSGSVGLYFVLYRPLFERAVQANPALADIPVVSSIPELLAAGFAVLIMLAKGFRLVRLLNFRPVAPSAGAKTM